MLHLRMDLEEIQLCQHIGACKLWLWRQSSSWTQRLSRILLCAEKEKLACDSIMMPRRSDRRHPAKCNMDNNKEQ